MTFESKSPKTWASFSNGVFVKTEHVGLLYTFGHKAKQEQNTLSII